jgi:hypothetical protein
LLQMVIFSNLVAIATVSEFVINLLGVWIVGIFVWILSFIFISLSFAWKYGVEQRSWVNSDMLVVWFGGNMVAVGVNLK